MLFSTGFLFALSVSSAEVRCRLGFCRRINAAHLSDGLRKPKRLRSHRNTGSSQQVNIALPDAPSLPQETRKGWGTQVLWRDADGGSQAFQTHSRSHYCTNRGAESKHHQGRRIKIRPGARRVISRAENEAKDAAGGHGASAGILCPGRDSGGYSAHDGA
jgi:hypothetical protein